MHKPFVSIIVPGIRTYNWEKLYHSISQSTKMGFELILCGPDPLPIALNQFYNIKYVRDFGSPVRCSNIAASLAEGDLITWGADDGIFLPNAIDHCVKHFYSMPNHLKNVSVWRYTESNNTYSSQYYLINHHDALRSRFIPKDSLIFNGALMYKKYFDELGGWDSKYESTSWAHTDMAIRAKVDGANISLFSNGPIFDCYQEKDGGDHQPIESAFNEVDQPLYQETYRHAGFINKISTPSLNDWKDKESIWSRRFDSSKLYISKE
jgi:hypothetical protein